MDTKEKMERINFLLPESWKRALALVAADQDKTPSELLRDCVYQTVTAYREGIFFTLAGREDGHIRSDSENEARR